MTNPQLQFARQRAQRTYDQRRARTAAETLVNIPPGQWDDATRSIIITLATLAIPSRIDGPLVEAFEPPIGALNDGYVAADDDPLLVPPRSSRCLRRHQHDTPDDAYACDTLPGPAPVGPCSTPCGQIDCEVACRRMHDNGDYRA